MTTNLVFRRGILVRFLEAVAFRSRVEVALVEVLVRLKTKNNRGLIELGKDATGSGIQTAFYLLAHCANAMTSRAIHD